MRSSSSAYAWSWYATARRRRAASSGSRMRGVHTGGCNSACGEVRLTASARQAPRAGAPLAAVGSRGALGLQRSARRVGVRLQPAAPRLAARAPCHLEGERERLGGVETATQRAPACWGESVVRVSRARRLAAARAPRLPANHHADPMDLGGCGSSTTAPTPRRSDFVADVRLVFENAKSPTTARARCCTPTPRSCSRSSTTASLAVRARWGICGAGTSRERHGPALPGLRPRRAACDNVCNARAVVVAKGVEGRAGRPRSRKPTDVGLPVGGRTADGQSASRTPDRRICAPDVSLDRIELSAHACILLLALAGNVSRC